jgi:hypothetical protein
LIVSVAVLLLGIRAQAADDLRRYQHGIDFVPRGDAKYWLIWSSSGNPPSGKWTHNVYYSLIDPTGPQITPQTIISNPEAQEPPSSDISDDGHIMITLEDGYGGIRQHCGVYDEDLKGVNAYPQMVHKGGHSGHVAAVGNRFVVFYSDEWCRRGGVDNLGSGRDVRLKVYSSTGDYQRAEAVAANGDCANPDDRNWWPLVAGSSNHAFLLWQRFVGGQIYARLMCAVYHPETGDYVKGITQLESNVKYYTYDVQYYPSIDRFLVVGAYHDGGGFAYLFDNDGNIKAQNHSLPPIIRETQPAADALANGVRIVYPTFPNGAIVLWVTSSGVSLSETIPDSYDWYYMGTDGIFLDSDTVYIVSTSPTGLVEKKFTISGGPGQAPVKRAL